ncbi:MAG TPA: hypothetical protein VG963_00015 [Polyangiaceae bacterium]|nr:hypothetical protein [Polyangiaceae bacterium]
MQTSPPLVGFNNNVRYRGRRFHIQTEDSGVNRPHIITHLFADGGHIIKTLRTDYSEHVGSADRPQLVHRLMREQHLAMALDLRDGRLDPTIDRLLAAPASAVQAPAPPPTSALPPAAAAGPDEATAPASSQTRAAAAATASVTPDQTRDAEADPARETEPRKRSAKPKARPSLPQRKRSRPSVVLPNRPSGESIFGAAPQESLDDVILTYASAAKAAPSSRRGKT